MKSCKPLNLHQVSFARKLPYICFKRGRLTLGYASRLADMPLNAFRQLLKQRKIALHFYNVEDFELDLKNLRELGRL
jgi:predicted HTH domain antitoxin